MMTHLKGLDTGVLIHENNFFALALKIKYSNDQTELFYMQENVLRDFLMLLQNRLYFLLRKTHSDLQMVKDITSKENQSLIDNIPKMEIIDIQNPDISRRITTLSASYEEEQFKLLVILNDESIRHIKILDAQVEFIAIAIAQSLNKSGMSDLGRQLSAALNYAPVYDAQFQPDGTIDYSLIECETWKIDLFDKYFLVIYGIETGSGVDFRFGAVIRAHAEIDEQEMDNIARHFASLSKRSAQYVPLISDIRTLELLFNKDMLPSPQEALQPLAEFKKALQSE